MMGKVLQPHLSEQQINMDIQQQERRHEDWGWSREATLLMLSLYKPLLPKFDFGTQRKKRLFEEVSEKLNIHMLFYSADQCSGRLKALPPAYKALKVHKSKSRNDRKTYQYELFGARQDVQSIPWDIIIMFDDTNNVDETWSSLFLNIADKHLPLKQHRVKRQQHQK